MSKVTSASSSTKLRKIYDSLPEEARQHLENAKRVVSSATRLQKRYQNTPSIDLKSKKKEIRSLLNALRRDSKLSFLKDKQRSSRAEILSEIIESLTNWIQVIWSVVYEHKVNFAQLMPRCYMFGKLFSRLVITLVREGVKCSVAILPVDLAIRSTSGKLINRFAHRNIENMDKILLWVWRELFVSMLAANERQGKKKIPEMLLDIEDCLGWKSLIYALRGGSTGYEDEDEDDCMDDPSEDEDLDEDDSYCASDDEDEKCTCKFHAKHWSSTINQKRLVVRDLVMERLHELFSLEPSLPLYIAMMDLSEEPVSTTDELMEVLSTIATSSSSNFAAALGIYASETDADSIIDLLDSHSHLLRPQDSNSYQAAVLTLSEEPEYRPRALKIIETELNETVHSIHLLLQSCFKGITEETHLAELKRVLKLQLASQQRIDRAIGCSDDDGNPPPGLGDDDDGDTMGYLEDPDDPDLEDLREELRPRLKTRFLGWEAVAVATKGGANVLAKVYNKMVEDMPFLLGSDITDAMILRLNDRPSKEHIMDSLEELQIFAKEQKRKKALRKKRNTNAANVTSAKSANSGKTSAASKTSNTNTNTNSSGTGSGTNLNPSFSFGRSSDPTTPTTPTPPAQAPVYGGLDDVD
ncbi:hypothetical protein BT96DRAFT_1019281 [Gymnopus androsaceus JB14]|uniref:Uncharacterized protein n=1 Tax=Gymnopus androsaceus JB14 TaxID=1447944 RepID=A0A6A4HSV9_9AGAR|nr:hypothetical protein BT96DRAFT_1019281 [Gymnopus androsaceus JB14]